MQSVGDNNTSSSSASSSRWVPPMSGAQGGRISNRPSSNDNDDARDARNANYQRDAQHQGGGVEECRQGGFCINSKGMAWIYGPFSAYFTTQPIMVLNSR